MHVAFRKRPVGFFSHLIRLWTRGPYSHCELVFSAGLCFSSDEADGGTRFKHLALSPDTWDLVKIPIGPRVEGEIFALCSAENDCKYDWRGIAFSFLPIPIGWQHPERWFCSEICAAGLQRAGFLTGHAPAALSPNSLYRALMKELSHGKP